MIPANLNSRNNLSDEQILMDNILDSFNSYWDVNRHPLWWLYYFGVFIWGKAFIILNKSFDKFIHQVLIEHCCSQALFWALEIHWSTKQRFCPCGDALVMPWKCETHLYSQPSVSAGSASMDSTSHGSKIFRGKI